MELYVKMTDDEYEEYKENKQKKYFLDTANPKEYLKRNGFEEIHAHIGYNPITCKNTSKTSYKKDNCTITIEVELL